MIEAMQDRFERAAAVIQDAGRRLAPKLAQAVEIILTALRSGKKVLLLGNGGSAADAQHIAGELVGRLLRERKALPAVALSTDTSILTALGNDYGFDTIFVRQIEALAVAGDVAVALTTSGNSPNVVTALKRARELGLKTVVFTGPGGGKCAPLADVLLDVAGDSTSPRIQEAHAVLYHTLCEFVEKGIAE